MLFLEQMTFFNSCDLALSFTFKCGLGLCAICEGVFDHLLAVEILSPFIEAILKQKLFIRSRHVKEACGVHTRSGWGWPRQLSHHGGMYGLDTFLIMVAFWMPNASCTE